MYTFLKNCGADFVKVDCQSSIEWFYNELEYVGQVAKNIHTAVEGAVGSFFDGTVINCMGCANENIWNRPNSRINRCSNDFLPEDRKWFIKHLMQCSYNCYNYEGLYTGDWDMFWTDDAQAVKNGGTFAFYSESVPKTVLLNGKEVKPEIKDNYYTLNISKIAAEHTLEFYF